MEEDRIVGMVTEDYTAKAGGLFVDHHVANEAITKKCTKYNITYLPRKL